VADKQNKLSMLGKIPILGLKQNNFVVIYTIRTTRLKYFGHIARADPSIDHSRALRASVAPLPRDWKRQAGRRVTPGFGPSSLTLHLSTLV